MSEIKVVPYIPDEDYDNPAMVVDFYEFTMANCLFLNGFKDTTLCLICSSARTRITRATPSAPASAS